MECFTIPEDGSLVRVFHAVPNAAAVDVYVNDSLVFQNINYRQFTQYIPITAGDYVITLYATNTTAPALVSVDLSIPSGGIFTVVATGNLDDLQLLVLDDMASDEMMDDYSQIRMVHVAPNAPAVTVLIDMMPFVEDISFREMTPYASIPSGSYVVSVTNGATILLTFRIQLRENFISTIYIIGDINSLSALQTIDGSSYLCDSMTRS